MTLVPRIDESACAAHGDCVDIAPGVFELDDVAVVIGDGPPDLILEAARAMPVVGDHRGRRRHGRDRLSQTRSVLATAFRARFRGSGVDRATVTARTERGTT